MMLGVICIAFSRTPLQCWKLHRERPSLKAQHAHPGACPVQPVLECSGLFSGLHDAEISDILSRDSPGEFAAVNRFSQSTGMKNMERKGGEARRETILRSLLQPKNPLSFDECAGVRRRDVTGGLWVKRRVGFQG